MAATCFLPGFAPHNFPDPSFDPSVDADVHQAQAVLAGGCFWCTEAVYLQLNGVDSVEPGYSGGQAETADYKSVCTGSTGHAEAIRINYDPHKISLGRLLKVFFSVAHDPTQLNRQGHDIGTQYRSAFFFADDAQREVVSRYIEQLNAAGIFNAPIVTTLEPLEAFYPAETYHRDYAAQNPEQPFIRAVAAPKVAKLKEWHADKVKPQ